MQSELLQTEDQGDLDLSSLSRFLHAKGLKLDRSVEPVRLSGGLSNINYLVSVSGTKMVLRRPPPGELPVGAHDMAREHRILSRLSQVFDRAPQSFLLCEDRSVMGVPFQLMEYRQGRVIQGDTLPDEYASHELRRALSFELVDTLADFHRINPGEIDLGDFGRPEGFFLRNVAGWNKRAGAITDDQTTLASVETICNWLHSHEPEALQPTLLHSDFKLDNCMLDDRGNITTILDWDMGTRGNPLMDLATLTSYWTEAHDPDCLQRLGQMPTALPGFITRDEVISRYAERSGRDVRSFSAWRTLSLLKLGVVFLQLHRNWSRSEREDRTYTDFARLGHDIIEYTHSQIH